VLQQLNEALAKVDRAILATTEAVVSATQKLVELNAVRDKLLTLIEDLKARGTH
jgi:sulfur transfer complex TusBCD TusB component (DsrH family)